MSGGRLDRRALLAAAVLAGVGSAAGCGHRAVPPGTQVLPADGGGGITPTPFPTQTTPPPPQPSPSGSPSPADWKALAESLSGRLFRPGDAGYPVAHQLFDPAYDSVLPAAVAECADTTDVVTMLAFIRRFGLGVVGKSGGHSYVGASTTQGGVVISVRPIAAISVSGTTAQVGAGASLVELYTALGNKGRVIPAGSCPSVGAAGLSLGGGLGLANRVYGLTCDVIKQVQVVTPDGKVRTANSSTEPELYWACRGGGGGTLGVVTAFTYDTFASPLIGTFSAQWRWADATKVVQGWQQYMQSASDQVWVSLRLNSNANGTQSVSVFGVDVSNDPNAALDKLVARVGVEPVTQTSHKNRRFVPDPPDARTVFYAGTDILGHPLPAAGISSLLAAMNNAAHVIKIGAVAIFDPLGGAVARKAVNATAFPWRTSFCSIQWYSQSSNAKGARVWIASGHKAVADSAVGGYVNYLEASRPFGSLYFGPNLPRLRAAKAMYDPTNVFKLPYSL